jgi:hypothetical protein
LPFIVSLTENYVRNVFEWKVGCLKFLFGSIRVSITFPNFFIFPLRFLKGSKIIEKLKICSKIARFNKTTHTSKGKLEKNLLNVPTILNYFTIYFFFFSFPTALTHFFHTVLHLNFVVWPTTPFFLQQNCCLGRKKETKKK